MPCWSVSSKSSYYHALLYFCLTVKANKVTTPERTTRHPHITRAIEVTMQTVLISNCYAYIHLCQLCHAYCSSLPDIPCLLFISASYAMLIVHLSQLCHAYCSSLPAMPCILFISDSYAMHIVHLFRLCHAYCSYLPVMPCLWFISAGYAMPILFISAGYAMHIVYFCRLCHAYCSSLPVTPCLLFISAGYAMPLFISAGYAMPIVHLCRLCIAYRSSLPAMPCLLFISADYAMPIVHLCRLSMHASMFPGNDERISWECREPLRARLFFHNCCLYSRVCVQPHLYSCICCAYMCCLCTATSLCMHLLYINTGMHTEWHTWRYLLCCYRVTHVMLPIMLLPSDTRDVTYSAVTKWHTWCYL